MFSRLFPTPLCRLLSTTSRFATEGSLMGDTRRFSTSCRFLAPKRRPLAARQAASTPTKLAANDPNRKTETSTHTKSTKAVKTLSVSGGNKGTTQSKHLKKSTEKMPTPPTSSSAKGREKNPKRKNVKETECNAKSVPSATKRRGRTPSDGPAPRVSADPIALDAQRTAVEWRLARWDTDGPTDSTEDAADGAVVGAVLTRAARNASGLPALSAFLHAKAEWQRRQLSSGGKPRAAPMREAVQLEWQRTAEVVRSAELLCDFLSFLRVYRASTFGSVSVYQSALCALTEALLEWTREMTAQSQSPVGQTGAPTKAKRRNVTRACMWLALELRRGQMTASPTAAASQSRQDWAVPPLRQLLSAASPLLAGDGHPVIAPQTSPPTLSDSIVELALRHIAESTHRGETNASDAPTRTAQHGRTAAAWNAVEAHLQRIPTSPTVTAAETFDVLDAMRLLALVEVVLPPQSRERLKRSATNGFQRLCGSVATAPSVFRDVLCSADVAQRVRALPSADLRNAVETAVFTGAAVFSETADAAQLELLIRHVKASANPQSFPQKGRCETKMNTTAKDDKPLTQLKNGNGHIHNSTNKDNEEEEKDDADDEDEDEDEDEHEVEEVDIPKFRRTRVALALFAAGYEPSAVVRSGLCVGHSAVEVLEFLRTAAPFSRRFALSPLPPHLATALLEESAAKMEGRIRAANRAGETMIMVHDTPTPLGERMGDGNDDPLVDALHLALGTAMELLVRGEGRRLGGHLVRLFTLLEREGSYPYLVDGFALLMDGFAERRRATGRWSDRTTPRHSPSRNATPTDGAGSDKNTKGTSIPPATAAAAAAVTEISTVIASTTLEVEEALTDAGALCVPRVVEASQRRLAHAKRSIAAMETAEAQTEAASLMEYTLKLTAYIIACGLQPATARQLIGLHATAVKLDGSASLADTVRRMQLLVSYVGARRRDFGPARHLEAPALRNTATVLHDVVAAHLRPVAAAARQGKAADVQDRHQVLAIVSLLFRLAVDHTVEAEPAELRGFRTDVLDPALTRVLREENASQTSRHDLTLDLDALGEITVVMCAPHTIHHLSMELLDEITTSVTSAVPRISILDAFTQRQHVSKAAARVLVSAAAVCQLRQERRTARFLSMMDVLATLLLPSELSTVLSACVAVHAPAESSIITTLRDRLADEAASINSSLSVHETMSALQVLCELEGASRLPYATILRRIIQSGHQLSPGEAGLVARIVSKRLAAVSNGEVATFQLSPEDLTFLRTLPAAVAETALRGRQQCSPAELPRVLQGFSQLSRQDYGELQQRVMHAYILRTIQLCPQLGAQAIVECIESYAAARVSHEYLFGVLLARVTDVRVKFSLPLAVRLVTCGMRANWDKAVQTACITASQPVFLGLVRHLLQSDPASLPSVSSHAVVVLHCLAEAFPNDPVSDLVLQNISTYHKSLSIPTMTAALQLIARKRSTEYSILRCMTEQATNTLFPQAASTAFAEMTLLLVRCGVRSRTLFEGVARRFKELHTKCDGGVLATLAEAFAAAHVDLEPDLIAMIVDRTVELAEEQQKSEKARKKRAQSEDKNISDNDGKTKKHENHPSSTFQLPHCVTLLKLFSLVSYDHCQRATKLLLDCATTALPDKSTEESSEDLEILLSSSIRAAPPPHTMLTTRCADALLEILQADNKPNETEVQRHIPGNIDIMLLVNLTSHLVQLGLSKHETVPLMFNMLYEKRSELMRRRLLLQTATEAIKTAGEKSHQKLYQLLVNGKLLA